MAARRMSLSVGLIPTWTFPWGQLLAILSGLGCLGRRMWWCGRCWSVSPVSVTEAQSRGFGKKGLMLLR